MVYLNTPAELKPQAYNSLIEGGPTTTHFQLKNTFENQTLQKLYSCFFLTSKCVSQKPLNSPYNMVFGFLYKGIDLMNMDIPSSVAPMKIFKNRYRVVKYILFV